MARFKKKKSEATPGPDDSKKESRDLGLNDIPETEKSDPVPDKAEDPSINVSEKSEKDRKLNRLFWMRVGLAVIAGAIATFVFEDIEGEERRWASIAFMIIVFIGTIIVAKGMKLQLPSSDRKKIVTQAIGRYVFLYLFTWIVTYTLLHAGTVSTGINI